MGSSTLIQELKKNAEEFHPVVPFSLEKDRLCQLDFTANNHDLSDDILNDTIKFSEYINRKLADVIAFALTPIITPNSSPVKTFLMIVP